MSLHSNAHKPIPIIRSKLQDNGLHSSEHLVDRIRRGELLRVRRGFYIPAQPWAEAPPWTKYEVAICALASARDAIFCRESALVLHGIPLLNPPRTLQARTEDPGKVKIYRPTPMTAPVPLEHFRKRYQQTHQQAEPLNPATLNNFPLKLREAACPQELSRVALRAKMRAGEHSIPTVTLGAGTLRSAQGPKHGYLTEPLGLAAVDTASRASFTEAIVILDAVKARDETAVEPWFHYLRTQRQKSQWEKAWRFADGSAESALESESRAVLAQIGCPAPRLQRIVRTGIGDFRMDFCWERERIAGEVDGRVKYFDPQYSNGLDPAEVHYREKQRREALEAEGWKLVRWGKAELRNPRELIKRLSRAGLRPALWAGLEEPDWKRRAGKFQPTVGVSGHLQEVDFSTTR